jgi:hypothetical protein
MYRYGMFSALAFGAVALMSGTTSAGVAAGVPQLQVKPSTSIVQQVDHRWRHHRCHRHCHYVGPIKICKRKCWD